MQKCFSFLFSFLFWGNIFLFAQNEGKLNKQKIVVFTPLYLDSVFDINGSFRYDSIFPKFINPGLEFYEGVQTAIDSLQKVNKNFEIFIFDSRSKKKSLLQNLNATTLKDLGLIIAYTTVSESRELADFAKEKKIPYINVNLPNDGNINNNPWFVLLNPSLKTHTDGIGKFIKQNYPAKSVIVFRKKGAMEDLISSYLTPFNQTTSKDFLNLKFVDLNEKYSLQQLTNQLDSTQQNICIIASLDEKFCLHLAYQLASVGELYPLTILGMPTLNNLSKDFARSEFQAITVIYGHPFYIEKSNKLNQQLTNQFQFLMNARPSDMYFRGFEVMMKYAQLLYKYNSDLSSQLTLKEFNVFTDFDVQPIINKHTLTLEYFENKKLYFLKWKEGMIKEVL